MQKDIFNGLALFFAYKSKLNFPMNDCGIVQVYMDNQLKVLSNKLDKILDKLG